MTYDKFLRPTEHFNKTSVKLAQTFIHVGLDEVESVFQVHSLTRMVCKIYRYFHLNSASNKCQ